MSGNKTNIHTPRLFTMSFEMGSFRQIEKMTSFLYQLIRLSISSVTISLVIQWKFILHISYHRNIGMVRFFSVSVRTNNIDK